MKLDENVKIIKYSQNHQKYREGLVRKKLQQKLYIIKWLLWNITLNLPGSNVFVSCLIRMVYDTSQKLKA